MASEPTSSLAALLPILQAFNHRHRNQNRSTHWWPSFNMLHRSLHSLAAKPPDPEPHLRRLSHLLPRAYISFSQLVSDEQFAPLGLLLLTILARVNSIIVAMTRQLLPQSSTVPSLLTSQAHSHQLDNLDKGVLLTRPALSPLEHKTHANHHDPTLKTPATKSKSKKKSKADALSSLFASLDP